jgi:hypothetical protein
VLHSKDQTVTRGSMWISTIQHVTLLWFCLWIQCFASDILFMLWLSYNCFDYLVHVVVFSTLGQRWLASTQSSWRGSPETAIWGLLLPWAAPLLLPHAMRWEAPAAAAPLLLPRATRWEAPVATAPLLLPHARRRLHSNDSVEMWVVAPPPPLRLQVAPPPPTRLASIEKEL